MNLASALFQSPFFDPSAPVGSSGVKPDPDDWRGGEETNQDFEARIRLISAHLGGSGDKASRSKRKKHFELSSEKDSKLAELWLIATRTSETFANFEEISERLAERIANASSRIVRGTQDSDLEWIERHSADFPGKWVAVDQGRLIAHGESGREVRRAAREAGVELPLVAFIPARKLPFGGW